MPAFSPNATQLILPSTDKSAASVLEDRRPGALSQFFTHWMSILTRSLTLSSARTVATPHAHEELLRPAMERRRRSSLGKGNPIRSRA